MVLEEQSASNQQNSLLSRIDDLESELQRSEQANSSLGGRLKEALDSMIKSETLASEKETQRAQLQEKLSKIEQIKKTTKDSDDKRENEIKKKENLEKYLAF